MLLLDRGAKIDSLNVKEGGSYEGNTPPGMSVLMKDDCAELAELSPAAGADTSVMFKGESLAQIAEKNGNAKILKVLGAG